MLEYYIGVVLEMNDELEFGKYQGCTIADIIEDDLDYIEWMISEGIEFGETVLDAVN